MKPFKIIRGYWAAILFGIVGAFTIILCTEIVRMFYRDGFCSPDDLSGIACFRQWVGALSGWAAAIAAGITIYFLYGQTQTQRKQMAYAIGEADPDFLIERGDDTNRCVLRVVNFSRHNIVVDQVNIQQPDFAFVSGGYIDGKCYAGNQPRFLVKGNRGKPAGTVTRHFTINFSRMPGYPNIDIGTGEFVLEISYRKIGQRHTKHTALCHALSRQTY
ncbi:hypothetical protein [Brucella sp. LJL56]